MEKFNSFEDLNQRIKIFQTLKIMIVKFSNYISLAYTRMNVTKILFCIHKAFIPHRYDIRGCFLNLKNCAKGVLVFHYFHASLFTHQGITFAFQKRIRYIVFQNLAFCCLVFHFGSYCFGSRRAAYKLLSKNI